MTKGQNQWALQSNQWNQVMKREQWGIWYSKRVQGRGSQKSVTRCLALTY